MSDMTASNSRKKQENGPGSLRNRLQANAPRYGVEGCPQCQGLGIVFDARQAKPVPMNSASVTKTDAAAAVRLLTCFLMTLKMPWFPARCDLPIWHFSA